MRWKIETFHKILKSGCRAEQSKLRTAERLVNLLAMFCILGWRIFWLTMINRAVPQAPPDAGLHRSWRSDSSIDLVGTYRTSLRRLRRLLSHQARAARRLPGTHRDPPPGNQVIWKGMARLTDIELGYLLAKGNVGN